MPEPLRWQVATVTAIRPETARATTFELEVPEWRSHRAGQHVDVRLTAPDGYQAQRSYSIASPPGDGRLELTIERIPEGEVSPYFHDVLQVGDQVELRGPIGGYFVWEPAFGGPLLLVAGGSGVVPLMAILRERAARDGHVPSTLLYSARDADDLIYRAELDQLAGVDDGFRLVETLTRSQPPGWTGYTRRVDEAMLAEVLPASGPQPITYLCGPTLLVEAAAAALVELGVEPARIRTERFGPTG